MKKCNPLLAPLFVVFLLAGCAGNEAAKSDSPEDNKSTSSTQTSPATDKGSAGGDSLSEQERRKAQMADLLAQRLVHFAFDSSAIDDEARAIIEAHASNLAANSQTKVSLVGHGDERGTREYNLALGERRAQSVEKLMRVLGVAGNRITTVSYGEEKPLCAEHNESCWRQNRRVEIVYK